MRSEEPGVIGIGDDHLGTSSNLGAVRNALAMIERIADAVFVRVGQRRVEERESIRQFLGIGQTVAIGNTHSPDRYRLVPPASVEALGSCEYVAV